MYGHVSYQVMQLCCGSLNKYVTFITSGVCIGNYYIVNLQVLKECELEYLQEEFDGYVKQKIITTILDLQGKSSQMSQLTKGSGETPVPPQVCTFFLHVLHALEGASPQRVRLQNQYCMCLVIHVNSCKG